MAGAKRSQVLEPIVVSLKKINATDLVRFYFAFLDITIPDLR